MTTGEMTFRGYHRKQQFNTNECSMNNKIHDRTHTIIQKDTKKDGQHKLN